jgi:putative ABC transport system permease protein
MTRPSSSSYKTPPSIVKTDFSGKVFILCLLVDERKKEFAILRGMGASRRELSLIMLREAFYVSALGSLTGAVLASAGLTLFGNLIRSSLDLPFLLPAAGCFVGLFVAALAASILAGMLSSALCVSKVSHVDTAFVLRGDN